MGAAATLSAVREGLGPGGGFPDCGVGLQRRRPGSSSARRLRLPPTAAQVGSAPGSMASRGRKRKAEAEVVAAAGKREKPAGDRKSVEEATVVIEHW